MSHMKICSKRVRLRSIPENKYLLKFLGKSAYSIVSTRLGSGYQLIYKIDNPGCYDEFYAWRFEEVEEELVSYEDML